MPVKKKKVPTVIQMLLDEREEMTAVLENHKPSKFLAMITNEDVDAETRARTFEKKTAQMTEMMEALEAGPLRLGRFVRMLETSVGGVRRAVIMLHDGAPAASPVPDAEMAASLRCGDGVLLDAQGRAVLYRDPSLPTTGEAGVLERRISEREVLVTSERDERRVMFAAQALIDGLEAGEVEPGATLLLSTQQGFAYDVLPDDDVLAHYRFLDRTPVPADVRMGCPPEYVAEFVEHAEMVLRAPETIEDWRLHMSRFALLEGVTGAGKTMSVELLEQELARVTSEFTGVAVDELPPFVFRLRPSEIYDKWVGSSDRNLKRFFNEIEQMAAQPFVTPDGRTFDRRPLLCVIEEFEGVARRRGGGDPIFDRILVTLLQYLDQTRAAISGNFVFWVTTTNLIEQVDSAAIRRVGGLVEQFRHLTQSGFAAVMDKQLEGVPLAPIDGANDADAVRQLVIADLTGWLYAPNGEDPGQVELILSNGNPEKRYRRDFLTGAVCARSVQAAASEACAAEFRTGLREGLTAERLKETIDRQVASMADNLTAQNVASTIAVPEGAHVSDVRRIAPPALHPFQLRTAS